MSEEEDEFGGGTAESPAAPTAPGSSVVDQVATTVSSLTGLLQLVGSQVRGSAFMSSATSAWNSFVSQNPNLLGAMKMRGPSQLSQNLDKFISPILNNPLFQGGMVALSGYSLYRGVQGLVRGGYNPVTIGTTAMTTIGFIAGVNTFLAGLGASSAVTGIAAGAGTAASAGGLGGFMSTFFSVGALGGPAGLIAAAAIIGIAATLALVLRENPFLTAAKAENKAVEPIVWSAGPIVMVGMGTIMLMSGWTGSTPPPAFSEVYMPTYHLAQMAQAAGGGIQESFNTKASGPVTFVDKALGQVMVVSPQGMDARGNPISMVQTFMLRDNLNIRAPAKPEDSYIPFFIFVKGKPQPNPEIMKSMQTQMNLLNAVNRGMIEGLDGMNALLVASSANKYDTTPTNGF